MVRGQAASARHEVPRGPYQTVSMVYFILGIFRTDLWVYLLHCDYILLIINDFYFFLSWCVENLVVTLCRFENCTKYDYKLLNLIFGLLFHKRS